jgi:hypothetical protein
MSTNVLTLPGVDLESGPTLHLQVKGRSFPVRIDTDQNRRLTIGQLQVRIAALEAKNARLLALLNDPRRMAHRAIKLLNGHQRPSSYTGNTKLHLLH